MSEGLARARSTRGILAVAVVVASVTAPSASASAAPQGASGAQPETPPTHGSAADPTDLVPPSLAPPPSLEPPHTEPSYAETHARPSLIWLLTQLVPSPALAFGRPSHIDVTGHGQRTTDVSFGFRWQVTPVLWSWGTHRGLSRWRAVVIDPVARFSGSLEAKLNLDYFLGSADRLLVRPGILANLPVFHRGEYLSLSLGTSAYLYDGIPRVAYDVGAHCLFGLFGAEFTFAPSHEPLRAIATFRIRYF